VRFGTGARESGKWQHLEKYVYITSVTTVSSLSNASVGTIVHYDPNRQLLQPAIKIPVYHDVYHSYCLLMSDIYFVAWPIAFQALVSHDTRTCIL